MSSATPKEPKDPKEQIRKKIKLPTKSAKAECFMPMLVSFAERDELNEVVKNKIAKSCELLESGISLHANGFVKKNHAAELMEHYEEAAPESLEALSEEFSLAGRIVSHRSFGKVAFFHLMDVSGRIQCYVAKEHVSEEMFSLFKRIDLGDIVGVRGKLFKTKTGELTLDCSYVTLLTRSFRSLPEKYHGLKDVETRYRQRYVDLIVTPKAREIAMKRIKIVSEFRRFMEREGFLEVETPMLQPIPGGATAKPFVTHHNALDMQLYMRIAPELYLKRLLVGGFEKVFELNRNFRNEGISVRHNPEFTMCEFYWAYATFEDLMDLTERLLSHLANEVCGSTVITYQGEEIDMTPGKWGRLSFHESLEKIGGHKPELYNDYEKLAAYIKNRGEKAVDGEKLGKLQAKLFDLDVEPKLVQPHFIYHYPTDISPLSRRNDANPDITDRFELFIAGREMGNAFSELNDPVDQRGRFEEQVKEKEAGDDEAHAMDEDYLRALEYGMPPAAGEGIGIDRLVMLLTDSASIREVILFPQLKPESL
ncbi:MAG: Lysine--tRNA ligase [Desulfovibrio sp.]